MDIHVLGERRFRIRHIDDSRPYLVGYVEPVIEHAIEESYETEELLAHARNEFEFFIKRNFSREGFTVQVVFPQDPCALSFTIANFLSIEDIKKQRMLETTDTIERLEDLLPILQQQIADIEQQILATEPQAEQRLSGEDLGEWITPN